MRIIWKDSKPRQFKPVKYRNHMVYGSHEGWTTTILGDDNIYASQDCALNAIDKALGGCGKMGVAKKRKAHGIKIVGKKEGESA